MSGFIGGGGGVPATHDHSGSSQGPNLAQAVVTGLESALSGKAAASHAHAQADVTGLESALSGKAAATHGHGHADITDFETAVQGIVAGDAVIIDGCEYFYRRAIAIDNVGKAAVADAQVRVAFTSGNFKFSHAASDGSDLRFRLDDGTDIEYYLESWNATTKTGAVWLQVNLPENAVLAVNVFSGAIGASSGSNPAIFALRIANILAAYEFEDLSGTSVPDRSGNSVTAATSPSWAGGTIEGPHGHTAINFQDAANQGLTLNLAEAPAAFGFWFRKPWWYSGRIIYNGASQVYVDTWGGTETHFCNPGRLYPSLQSLSLADGWHHCLMKMNGSVYIDGVAVIGGVPGFTSVTQILGDQSTGGGNGWAKFASPRLYGTAPTDQEIATLGANGGTGTVVLASGTEVAVTAHSAVATVGAETALGDQPLQNPMDAEGQHLLGGEDGALMKQTAEAWAEAVRVAAASLIPTGSIQAFGGAAAPTGWLLCDGSTVSRTTYAGLFAVLGTTFGAGDNSTTFHLPDLRGRTPMGAGTGLGLNASGTGAPTGTAMTARTLGQWLGEETHLLTSAESGVPMHAHPFSYYSDANHFTTEAIQGVGENQRQYATNYMTFESNTSNNTPVDAASRHATIPPAVVVNYIIRT